MKTCKQIAAEWNLSERTVTTFCKSGKIPGAVKNGKSWQIPDDAKKPVDGRIASGKYMKKTKIRKRNHFRLEYQIMCVHRQSIIM